MKSSFIDTSIEYVTPTAAIRTRRRHFYFESEGGTRSECQAAAVCGVGKSEERNGISLLCKAALSA